MNSPVLVMAGSYDYRLVALSILISILGAYTARELSERIGGIRSGAWLVGSALVDGIGIWSMHYTGMLAFRLPVPVQYDWPTVVLSLLVGVLGSAAALPVDSRPKIAWPRALTSSFFMGGLAISGLHFTAMAAMRLRGMHHYSPALTILSVALAIALSLAALALRDDAAHHSLQRHVSAWLRGSANPVMHYTAMAAVTYTYSTEAPDLSHAVSISPVAIVGVSIVPVTVLVVALLTSLVDRLQRQRALLDELFEQGPQAVLLMSAENRVVRVNREFTRLFGYTPQEAAGRPLNELIVPEEGQEEFRQFMDALARGQRVDADSIRRRKDSNRLRVSIVDVPVSLPGGQIAVYGIYRDITAQKQAEEQLRRSRAYLAESQRLSHVASWAVKIPPRELVFWSEEHYRMWGFDPEKGLPPLQTVLERIHPGDRVVAERVFETAIREKRDCDNSFRIVLPDGSIRFCHSIGHPILNGAGEVVEFIGTIEDVTERHLAEEKQRHSFEQLRALTARLQNVREAERTRVAREIHDELGQALTAVKIDVASLIRDLPPDRQHQAKAKSVLELVDRTIETVRRISTELRPGILDDMGLVAAIEWFAEEFQARTGIQRRLDLPKNDIVIDPEHATAIFRIFQETLTNIARHAQATQVDGRLSQDNGDIILEVRDNGRGIDVEQLSTTRSLGILGMRERARLLGGELTIRGVPGGGGQS